MRRSKIIDIEKSYSVQELRNLSIISVRIIEKSIGIAINNILSKKDKAIMSKFKEIQMAPYDYALNKDAFIMGREKAAEKRKKQIEKIKNDAHLVREKLFSKLPINIKTTLYSFQNMRENFRFLDKCISQ